MKRTLIKILTVLLLTMLICPAAALAAAGNAMFFMIDDYASAFTVCGSAAAMGDAGYIMTMDNGRNTIYRIRAGEAEPEGFVVDEAPGTPINYSTFLLFGYDGGLMGLNARSGIVYSIELTDGQAILTEKLSLDWEDMLGGYDPGSAPRELGKYVISGDTLYMTAFDPGSWNSMELIAFSLTDGSCRIVSRKNVIFSTYRPGAYGDLAAYKDGRLIAALPDENDREAAWRLCEISTEDGSVKEITKLSGVGAGGLVYDEAQDRVIYICGGMICATDFRGNHTELASAPVSAPNPEQCCGGTGLLDGGYYFVSGYDGSAVRNIGSAAGQLRTLIIAGDHAESDAAFLAFSEAHPEAAIRYQEGMLGTEEIVQAMMSASSEIDIYYLNTSDEAFRTLTGRGYAADLSESETLMGMTERMFPVFRDALIKDGRMIAFPKSVNAYGMTISVSAAEAIGLSREEWPDTWEELFDLIERWDEAYSKDFPEKTIFNPYQLADLKGTLLNEIMKAQAVSMNQSGGQASIDTPFMRNMMERLDSMSFAAFETDRDFSKGFSYDPQNALLDAGWPDLPAYMYREEGKESLLLAQSEDGNPMIGVDMYVYIVNPYSKNIDLATQYLETRAETMDVGLQATLCADWREPIRDPDAENELKLCEGWIAERKEALKSAADDQKQALENTISQMESWKQDILTRGDLWTEEQLAEYRELTEYFIMIENWYFSGSGSVEIRQIIARYLDGELSSEQMLSSLDQKLSMMRMEEGY